MAPPRVASREEEEEEFWTEGEHRGKQITLLAQPSPPVCPLETLGGGEAQTGLFLEQDKEKTQGSVSSPRNPTTFHPSTP